MELVAQAARRPGVIYSPAQKGRTSVIFVVIIL